MSDRMRIIPREVHVPAGTYFLGDPYNALSLEQWELLTEQTGNFKDSCVGSLQGGMQVLAFPAYNEAGTYADSEANTYEVVSGFIGLIPTEAMEDLPLIPEGYGRYVTFAAPTRCYFEYSGEHHRYGHVFIRTDTEAPGAE